MRSIVLCVAITLLTACSPSTTYTPSAPAALTTPSGSLASRPATATGALAPNATLRRVVDGDTVIVDIGEQRETVRLIGIDTPETVKPNAPVDCFGPEASARTKDLLPPGTALHLERDIEARDVYGRLLAYVYRSDDGDFINLRLAEEGFATVLTFEPNTAHRSDFVAAATRAERDDLGLWSACSTSAR